MKQLILTCKPILNGIMAYWEQVDEAANYVVNLYINEQAIAAHTNPRTELFYAFTGLASIDNTTVSLTDRICRDVQRIIYGGRSHYIASEHSGLDYYVTVSAENRAGEIIAESERIKCTVKEF